MIVGGLKNVKLNTVELFNWQTNEHCWLNNLTYPVNGHSGTVMDGTPGVN